MNPFKTSLMLTVLTTAVACAPITNDEAPPKLSMDIPDSLTGGSSTTNFKSKANTSAAMVAQSVNLDAPCTFRGIEVEDPFVNGYVLSKFLVSHMSALTCISDLVISIVDFTINDGQIHATDNVMGAENYKSDDPTHYQVTRTAAGLTKIRMFYAYLIENPPVNDSEAGFVLTWETNESGNISGVLSLDTKLIDDTIDIEEPIGLRLDFTQTASESINDMFLVFDDANTSTDGMRVIIKQDKTALFSAPVYTVQALIKIKKQWLDVSGVTETPMYKLFAITDKLGDGASRALVTDLAVPFEFTSDNHLGDYLFDKTDDYYFDADISKPNWQWIEKSVTKSTYVGSRNTPSTGGTWIPFSPSLDMLINALVLDDDYFTNGKCEVSGDNCNAFLNAVFLDGFDGQEPNQGSDPKDWRTEAMQNSEYPESVYLNGVDWEGTLLH